MNNDFDSSVGFAKFYHPRGPLVSLPVPHDPKEAFCYIGKCLDAGWLVRAPGLDEAEEQDDVGFILRGAHDGNGELTPYLLLYSTNEALGYSFLKVYLNTEKDVDDFEKASGMRLTELREYAGSDKPERGRSAKTDAYIVPVKRPLSVIFKPNPKWRESERNAASARGEIYKIPRRLFVRWDVRTETPQEPVKANGTPAPASIQTPTVDEQHKKAIHGMNVARDRQNLDDWLAWRNKVKGTTVQQDAEAKQTYSVNLDRLNGAKRNPAA
jgi:hypothetical protein